MSKVIRKEGQGESSFDTEHFGLASYLQGKGYEIRFLHPKDDNYRRIIFHFVLTDTIEQAARDYWNGKELAEGKKYPAKIKKPKINCVEWLDHED